MDESVRSQTNGRNLECRGTSGYGHVDTAADPHGLVQRLDAMRATAFWQSIKRQTYQLLELRPGSRVLEVGCGTGDDALALAELVEPDGQVVGLDSSSTMIAEARRRAAVRNLAVEFCQADARYLSFADGSFDGCRVERVLQHLDEPERAIAELVRVTRPGGRIVAVEPDYGTLTIEGADRAVTRKLLELRRAHFRSPRIGGELARIFRGLGLPETRTRLMPQLTDSLEPDVEAWLRRKYVLPGVEEGVVTEAEGAKWLSELRSAASASRLRHVVFVYIVSARQPLGSNR